MADESSTGNIFNQFNMIIQLPRGEGLDTINRFNPITFLCLSQAKIWISNVVFHGFFLCSVSEGERWLFILLILVELLTITV